MEIKTVLKAEIVKKYRTLGRRRIVAGYAAIIRSRLRRRRWRLNYN